MLNFIIQRLQVASCNLSFSMTSRVGVFLVFTSKRVVCKYRFPLYAGKPNLDVGKSCQEGNMTENMIENLKKCVEHRPLCKFKNVKLTSPAVTPSRFCTKTLTF